MNQQALNSSQENYQKAVANQGLIEGKMTQIKAKLKALEGTEKTLVRISDRLCFYLLRSAIGQR